MRSVFYVSDGTGLTAESLGRSLLTQFQEMTFRQANLPFVTDREMAEKVVERIRQATEDDGVRPIVFSTLIDPEVREIVRLSGARFFDFIGNYTGALEEELATRAQPAVGRSHGISNRGTYAERMAALHFTLHNDDGESDHDYGRAEIILTGVSRSGKTPVSLYLSLQYGIYAANYPLTEDDFTSRHLPRPLQPYRERLFGLTVQPERLHQVRSERRPDSRYAKVCQCATEIEAAEALFRRERIPFLDASHRSVEEIAATILQQAGLQRRV